MVCPRTKKKVDRYRHAGLTVTPIVDQLFYKEDYQQKGFLFSYSDSIIYETHFRASEKLKFFKNA